jgi:hypothetical protein
VQGAGAVAPAPPRTPAPEAGPAPPGGLKDALLAEIRAAKNTLYSLAIAQAQRIDVTGERVTFTFAANQNVARMQLEQNRDWIASAIERLAGRAIPVAVVQADAGAAPQAPAPAAAPVAAPSAAGPAPAATRDLKAEAMSSSAVQAVLEVFPAEIRDVEEM